MHSSYCHRINDTFQIGAEFETSVGMGESTATVGYQLEVPQVGVNFKGTYYCILGVGQPPPWLNG